MHPKNSTRPDVTQYRVTADVGFYDTPIDNRAASVFHVASGLNVEDALETAKILSSGLGQLCNHLYDSLNAGEMAYCDGARTLAFVAETISALVWSVQRSIPVTNGEERP